MTGCSDVLTLHSRERRLTSPRLEGADQPRRPFDGYQTVAHGLSERELAHVPSRQVFTLGRDDQVVEVSDDAAETCAAVHRAAAECPAGCF